MYALYNVNPWPICAKADVVCHGFVPSRSARRYICACVKVRARRVVLDRRPRTQERADAIQNMAPKGLGGTLHQTHL